MKTKLLKERLDYLNVIGDSSHINHKDEHTIVNLTQYFKNNFGFKILRNHKNLQFMSLEEARTIVVTFTRNKNSKGSIIKVEFPGGFLYGNTVVREQEIKTVIDKMWNDLSIETCPYSTAFDIAVDRMGATFGSHGICLTDTKYKLIHRKSKKFKYKVSTHHNNPDDLSEQTGQIISSNKFLMRSYDRIFALRQRYNTIAKTHYSAYFWKTYRGYERVLREEVKFKKELCGMFNILFWGHDMPLSKILPKCLSLFIKNHRFVYADTGEAVEEMDGLFYREDVKPLKRYIEDKGVEAPEKLIYKEEKIHLQKVMDKLATYYFEKGELEHLGSEAFARQLGGHIQSNAEKLIQNLKDRLQTELALSPKSKHSKIRIKYIDKITSLYEMKNKLEKELDFAIATMAY